MDAGAGAAIAQVSDVPRCRDDFQAIETLPSLTNLCLANCSMQAAQAIAIVSAVATNVQIRSARYFF